MNGNGKKCINAVHWGLQKYLPNASMIKKNLKKAKLKHKQAYKGWFCPAAPKNK